MKKSKILALVILTAVFASAFSVATITISPAHFVVGSTAPSVIDGTTVLHPEGQAWDTSNNKVRSADYTFFTAITVVTHGFGIIAGVFGLAVAVLFVKKLKK
ncbi:MAG: hypothetical protein ACTSO7_05845 [Candidatus Heimdallarchaeota archaeon]